METDNRKDWESICKPKKDYSGIEDDFSGDDGNKKRNRKRNKKGGSTLKGIFIGILISVFFIGGVFAGTFGYIKKSGYKVMFTAKDTANLKVVEAKLSLIQSIIDKNFIFKYDEDELADSVYKAYIDALGDPYTCYYTEDEYKEMMQQTEGTYYGIGILVSQDVETGVIQILRVFKNSPAMSSGIKDGDILYKVKGKEVTGTDVSKVVSEIKGSEGTTVNITVLRDKKEISMDVERKDVNVDTVYYKMIDNEIGYIELTDFYSVSTQQFKDGIEELKSKGMKKLIVDLRNNPGGLVDVAVDLSDIFIDKGKVVSVVDKAGDSTDYNAKEAGALDIPIVVLVNENSASASEIMAGCLKDYKKATILGTKTFGKGIVQSIIPLSDGSAMKITTAHYYTPDGNDIHKKGIEPDVTVKMNDKKPKVDEQLEAAVDLLKNNKK